jgi:hypothetical protein
MSVDRFHAYEWLLELYRDLAADADFQRRPFDQWTRLYNHVRMSSLDNLEMRLEALDALELLDKQDLLDWLEARTRGRQPKP